MAYYICLPGNLKKKNRTVIYNKIMEDNVRFCEKCGRKIFKDFGSGRFCSRGCANSHKRSEASKEKVRQSVLNSEKHKAAMRKYHSSDRYKKVSEAMKKRWGERPHRIGKLELDISNEEMRAYKENHLICEICGEVETCRVGQKTSGDKIRSLARDHQPGTNHFRGLLCTRCNQSLGWYERFSAEVARYLEKNIT